MSQFNAERRRFLRTASIVSGSVGAAGAPFALNLASLGTAVAQTAPDYKAIVCLFLYGGNDSSNMVLRTDAASFAEYTRMRNTGNDPIALLAPGTAPAGNATRASPSRLGGVL
ncbi:MAG: Tat pathway signal protein, partial [Caldimonas sp.]